MARLTKKEKEARAARMSVEQSYQTAKTVIAAQPLQAIEGLLDVALWGACVEGAQLFIANKPAVQSQLKGLVLQPTGWWLLLGPLGVLSGVFTPTPNNNTMPTPTEAQGWKAALVIGTLAFGTLKYAGGSVVDAVAGAAKTIGLAI